ncbi:MAG: hypothetical protein M1305_02140 [Candidatus Marsarchaeota archaeon]|nr:hypothetical protein [Candidatus Marsarchaeota archaeon]
MRALDFDTLDNVRQWYGSGDTLDGLPVPAKVKPAAVFKKSDPKRQLVTWNAEDALKLWQSRGPFAPRSLPKIFDSLDDVTEVPAGIVGRGKLILKLRTVEELMYFTRDDE